MTLNTESTVFLADPLVRSRCYHAFGLGFKYPTREAFELYQSGQLVSELMTFIASLPHLSGLALEEASLADKVSGDLERVTYEDFETNYVGTFDVGFPEPSCPPYEGVYSESMPRTEIMQEVSAFYSHFGLAMSQEEGKRELPDYLCAELEFLHFLTLKEAQARESGEASAPELAHGYLLAQHDFLERHLTGWLPKFAGKVQGVDGLVFYPDLARILVRFVNEEFALLRATVP